MPIPVAKTVKEPNYLKKSYLFYGKPKIGKTTIAAQFGEEPDNKILFFCTESGHKFQEIYSWETDEGGKPENFKHFDQFCREMYLGGEAYNCLAIDTLDNLWEWTEDYVCAQHGVEKLKDIPWGEGWKQVAREIKNRILPLMLKGNGIIFLTHEKIVDKREGPETIPYTDTTLANNAKKLVHGLCDYIFYFTIDEEGRRYIRTQPDVGVNAGDRSGVLPPKIAMDANKLKTLLKGGNK